MPTVSKMKHPLWR